LTNWSSISRQLAFDAINALTPTGGTNIGDSLRMAWDQLINYGNNSHDWALVLLSDGKEEASDPTETFDEVITALDDATGKRPVVHSIAIGEDADRLRMQRIAEVTGGTYQFASIPGTLVTTNGPTDINNLGLVMDFRHRVVATDIIGQQQFFNWVGPTTSNTYENVYILVEGSAAEMVLSLSWNGLMGDVFLYDPDNMQVSPFQSDPYGHHKIWRVSNPKAGNWRLYVEEYFIPADESDDISSPRTPSAIVPYLVQASLKSDVTMDVYLTTPEEDRKPGNPMGIAASLTDTGPIIGANVRVWVEFPDHTLALLQLYDDGMHGDGVADDGIYGNELLQTGQHGSYNLFFLAEGTSPISGAFVRQALLSFYFGWDPYLIEFDNDGDGLPYDWEIYYGTDPYVADGTLDPDCDGDNNLNEYNQGTHPFNSDTDGGGEGDDTDPDPLDPSDDGIIPPWGMAYAGDGETYIKYSYEPQWLATVVCRSNSVDGPWDLHGFGFPPSDVYTDTFDVQNDTQYCYNVAGLDTSGPRTMRSATSGPTCVIPREDPLPPHGGVLINNGAPTTKTPDVILTLWASDALDPEDESSMFFPPPPGSESGVTDMMISNYADMHDGSWEAYNTTKNWTLGKSSGLATVYVKYRDAAQNESEVYAASIWIGEGPGAQVQFLPIVSR
jgi:hypothetical protein